MITLDELDEFVRKGKNAQAAIDTLCRTTDPQTSKDAAKKMVESRELNKQEDRIYTEIVIHFGEEGDTFTTKEVARKWAEHIASQCPVKSKFNSWHSHYYKCYDICRKRFSGLVNKGKIERIQRTVNILGKERKVAIVKSGKPAWKRRDGCCIWRLL